MKCRLSFGLSALIALSVAVFGQDVPPLNEVTLYSKMGHREWRRASINFDSGERGSPTADYSDFDLVYGNFASNRDRDGNWFDSDWFVVSNPRSMIIDLGKKQWKDFKETPKVAKGMTRKPLPLRDPPIEIDGSAGSKEMSPYKQLVRVKAGHMYLMKVVRGRKSTYVMFRVDKLVRQDNCLLSWKKVQPPRDDIEK